MATGKVMEVGTLACLY